MDINFTGQEKAARKFLLDKKIVTAEDLALMNVYEVIRKIEDWVVANNFMILETDEDIILIPKEVEAYWFSR